MERVLKRFRESDKIKRIARLLDIDGQKIGIEKTLNSYYAFVIAALFEIRDDDFFVIIEDKEDAAYFFNDLQNILPTENILFFPVSYKTSTVTSIKKTHTPSLMMRSEVLRYLANKSGKRLIVSYPEAVAESVPPNRNLKTRQFTIKKGDELDTEFLEEWLLEEGFRRVQFVYEPGQFAVRGGIVDIFSFAAENPFRLDFFGDEVERIKIFNIENQLSYKEVNEVAILPDIRTMEDNDGKVSIFENLSKNTVFSVSDVRYFLDIIKGMHKKYKNITLINESGDEEKVRMISAETVEEILKKVKLLEFSAYSYFETHYFNIKVMSQPLFKKNFVLLADTMLNKYEECYEIYVLSNSDKQLQRLKEIFRSEEINKDVKFEPLKGIIRDGFIDKELKLLLFTEHQIFGRYHRNYLKDYSYSKAKSIQLLKAINDLRPGDYVVHTDFGIGIFRGLTTIENNGKKLEVLKIDYKGNDVLFVNVHSLHKISKYKSADSEPPVIHSLNSRYWKNLKRKAKSRVKDIAKQLISLYAQRMEAKGFAFSSDSYLQEALEASFFYDETPDQAAAIEAVKKDMEKPVPMDRLVCGDVGFGKTEVAIRAAFKAVIDGKQVAVLCPTTVLTYQHFKTFSERLKDFPVTVDFLSRMKSAKKQKEILEKLKEGKIDIIIGTHRIVSKDVQFKDLGLLIIDEEQRFGVAVKEKLRQLKVNVDTLTLTATPIPRTLEFSLMGARDLSVMNTPPLNRRPIITEVNTFSAELIKNAVELEISRGGQVFFVQNNINSLEGIKQMLINLVPNIRVAIAHGRMKSTDLEKIMTDFINREYDVLLTTTIIENGLDIPNANTIIINDAHKFGLAQLHQLRGRVGRSERQAFCYLLAPPKSALPINAKRRLETIEMFSEIGSGFNIALQDLDIRGAGNLIGAEQSGFINDIGLETFKNILKEAVYELRIENLKQNKDNIDRKDILFVDDCQVTTDLEANIPAWYISDVSERLRFYKEINVSANEEDLAKVLRKLRDRFGEPPKEVIELLNIVRLRWKAIKLGIEKIILKNNFMYAYFVSDKDSPFYDSSLFKEKILTFLASNRNVELKYKNDKIYLFVKKIFKVSQAIAFLDKISI